MKMSGSIISLHNLLELYHTNVSDLYTLLAEIADHFVAKLVLGSQCMVQGIKGLDVFGEKVFSNLAFVIMTKWKLLLLISTIIFCIFRLLQKTVREVEIRPTKEAFCLSRLFKMIKNAHKPGITADIISLIEKHNIDVNSKHPKSESGLTLFLCACLSGDGSLIAYMLNKGADVNSNTACKDSAIHLASFCCATQNVKNGLGVITSLYEAGCNINSKNWLGNTPLCIAASSGKCDLVRRLISLGGDKSICNNDGIYAMEFATNAGHLDAANLLAIDVPNPHVWDIVDPHTPPRVKLGLQSPCKQHLVYSSFRRRRMDFCTLMNTREILKELHSINLPWNEVLPPSLVNWLEVFSSSHNVVKEIMFPAILTSLSGLMAPKSKLKMSHIEFEPVNLFTIVLAPPGSGKSAALHAAIERPILAVEDNCDSPILVEDVTKNGLFVHLKETGGVGVLARDEVHVLMEEIVSSARKKDFDKDLLIKFFDNAAWTVNKGNTGKRDRIPFTALSFFGLSQPDSFFNIYSKMARMGNGLIDRILCCCPLPRRLIRAEVNASVDGLQGYSVRSLDSMYEYVYHKHQDQQPVIYTLSQEALDYFMEKEKELVNAQNKIFSGDAVPEATRNISKAAKLMLRLSVVLHVFIDRMTHALGQNLHGPGDIPTMIGLDSMQRAVILADWFLDSRQTLEKTVKRDRTGDLVQVSKTILKTPGPFVTFRAICRKAHVLTDTVGAAMGKLEKESLGTVNPELKCFFKTTPINVTEDNLQLYDMDIVQYSQCFRELNKSLTQNQWDLFMDNAPEQVVLAQYFPNGNRAAN